MIDKKAQGKKNRRAGKVFEARVRKDLEGLGWTVCKWGNTIDEKGDVVPCKALFNPFTKRVMMMSGGFPDFIAFMKTRFVQEDNANNYLVIGVECKIGKYLDEKEKQKIKLLKERNIFSRILIAWKDGKAIQYDEH